MSEFRRLTESELSRMGDEELVNYIVAAREAGQPAAAKDGVSILAWGYEDKITARVARKVAPAAIEDVVMTVLESVARSSFDGKVIGEFRAFIYTITKYRIADYYKAIERQPDQSPLPDGGDDEDGFWGREPSVDEDPLAQVAMRDAVHKVLERMTNPLHRRIVELYGPELVGEDLSTAQVIERLAAEGHTVTAANVQQVWHRFKVALAAELASGEDGGTPDG